jgi:hypothetical protein
VHAEFLLPFIIRTARHGTLPDLVAIEQGQQNHDAMHILSQTASAQDNKRHNGQS